MFVYLFGIGEKKEKVFDVDPNDKRATLVVNERGEERTYSHTPQKINVDERGTPTNYQNQERWHVPEQQQEKVFQEGRLHSIEERGRSIPVREYRQSEPTQSYNGPNAYQGPSKMSKIKDAFSGILSNRVEQLKAHEQLRAHRRLKESEAYESAYEAYLPHAMHNKAKEDIKQKFNLYTPEEKSQRKKEQEAQFKNISGTQGGINTAMFGFNPHETIKERRKVKRNGKWVIETVDTGERKHSAFMGGMMFGGKQQGPFSQPQEGYNYKGPSFFDFPNQAQKIERSIEKEVPRRKKQYSRETEPEEPREAPRSRGMYDF